jgi:hypothetical protein
MRGWSGYKLMMLAALVVSALVLPVAVAQTQRRRPSRRATNPVRPRPVTQPAPTPVPDSAEPTLVSTADEQDAEQTRPAKRKPASESQENARKFEQMSEEFTRMNRKLDALEKERQADLLQERLTRTEQRSETLRQQLTQTLEKQADLQARLEQVEYDLRPESIELRAATIPTLRADDVRTQIRQQLENEKKRVRTQHDVVEATRTHLETVIAETDAEVQRLRARLNQLIEKNFPTGDAAVAPSPTPASSPPPPAR